MISLKPAWAAFKSLWQADGHNAWGSKSQRRRQRQALLWVGVVLLALGLLFGTGNRGYGLFDVDEAIFTRATIELREAAAQHGIAALTMPTYNAEPRYHKPPLIYWAQSAALSLTGTDFTLHGWGLLGARLPSALAGLLTVAFLGFGVWYFTANRRWALYSAMAMALNLSFFVVARAATADGLLNLTSLLLALWVLALFYQPPLRAEAPLSTQLRLRGRMAQLQASGWLVTGTLASLAFLAKGPIAWLPAAVIALALLWARPNHGATWRVLAPIKSLFICTLLLAPWVGLLWHQHGADFFYEFFMVHNVQRFSGDLGNSQSSFGGYYLVVLLVGFFPWVAFLPAAVLNTLRKPSGRWWHGPELKARLSAPDAATALPLLTGLWAVVYVGLFSFSGTKLAHYIVPAYPALAILVGGWLANGLNPSAPPRRLWWAQRPWVQNTASVLWGLWGLVLATLLLIIPSLLMAARQPVLHGPWGVAQQFFGFPWPLPDTLAMAVLAQPIPIGYGFTLAGGLLVATTTTLLAVRKGKESLIPALAALQAGFLATLALGVVPVVWAYTQGPLAALATQLKTLPTSTLVVHHGLHKPSLLLLGRHPFTHTDHPLQVLALLKTTPELWLVAEQPDLRPLLLEMKSSQGGEVLSAKCVGGTCLLVLAPSAPSGILQP